MTGVKKSVGALNTEPVPKERNNLLADGWSFVGNSYGAITNGTGESMVVYEKAEDCDEDREQSIHIYTPENNWMPVLIGPANPFFKLVFISYHFDEIVSNVSE